MINATGNRMMAEIRRQSSLADAIERTQISVSTGKRLQTASDDPVASSRLATIRRGMSNDDTWLRNIEQGVTVAAQASDVVSSMSDRMVRAKELMVAAGNASLSASDRQTIGDELRSIANELDAYADTRSSNDEPLFSSGAALNVRYGEGQVFAPVPSRSDVFMVAGVSVAQLVRDAATAAETGDPTQISAALTNLDAGVTHLSNSEAKIGQSAARLDRMKESLLSHRIDMAAERSGLEDTDLTSAIAQLNAQVLTLDAAQAAFARINRRSLMDILS